jgi:hypothetical protein
VNNGRLQPRRTTNKGELAIKHWETKVSKDHRLKEQRLSQHSKHGSTTTLERLVYPALDQETAEVLSVESVVHQ